MIFFWLRWASLLRGPFSGIQEQGLLSRAVRGLLTAEASLDSAGPRGSGLVAGAPRLSRTGLVARRTCDLPRPGIKPRLLHLQGDSYLLYHQRSPASSYLKLVQLWSRKQRFLAWRRLRAPQFESSQRRLRMPRSEECAGAAPCYRQFMQTGVKTDSKAPK